MSETVKQVTLTELLRGVPRDARYLEGFASPDRDSCRSYPVGRLCHEAADELDALRSQVAVLRKALERVLKALDDEAKSESTLENAEANFSSTASDRRRYEDALIETSEALMKARAILEGTR